MAWPWPIWGEAERLNLVAALDSGRWWRMSFPDPLSPESHVVQFEKVFAERFGFDHALAVSSGTTALECALYALGAKPGDEVIVPACTFPGTASAVRTIGGTPVFADILAGDYTIDPSSVEVLINDRTVGVLAVDLGGAPVDAAALRSICDARGLFLLGDCSHAHGSRRSGIGVGKLSDAAVFSCSAVKLLAIGEAGVIATDDAGIHAALVRIHSMGLTIDDDGGPQFTWPATSARLAEFGPAIGLAALARFDEQLAIRSRNIATLHERLAATELFAPLDLADDVDVINPFRLHVKCRSVEFGVDVEAVRQALVHEGLPIGRGVTAPLYGMPMFADSVRPGWTCEVAERVHATESLDLFHAVLLLPEIDFERVIAAFDKVRTNVTSLRVAT